jgi:predicted MFS family arabinose efflux permease
VWPDTSRGSISDAPQPTRLAPLILATMASQSLMAVLAPTIVAIADDLGASVGAVGQARSLTSGVAISSAALIMARIDAVGVPRLLALGGGFGVVACAAVAAAPTLAVFLAAHALTGLAFACLLSAGFAGVAAFPGARRPWAIGYVASANALAWIVVNPSVGALTEGVSWRAAQAVPAAIALAALFAARNAAPVPGAPTPPRVRTLLAEGTARRWIGVELTAYAAWTALLTFVGAFFITELGVGAAATGWFLAAGAGAYFVTSTRSGALTKLIPRRRLVFAAAVLMAVLVAVLLNATQSVVGALVLYCLIGLAAGIRTPTSGGLGLEQLPHHPGAMMGARTAATQFGYLLGAVIGGAVIAGPGYGALGFVLAGALLLSAWLVLGVHDPLERGAKP